MNDIVTYLANIFLESVGLKRGGGQSVVDAFAKHDIHREKVAHIRHVFFDTSIEKVVNYSHHNKYVTVNIEVRLACASHALANSGPDGYP